MDLSVVIPVFDEEDNVRPLYEELKQALDPMQGSYEIIFVDDGSKDGSYDLLKQIQAQDAQVRLVRFRRNFGQTAAMAAGFQYSEGDVVVTMDGDRQNDPADIPRLMEKIDEGFDMVCGWRYDRKDKVWSRKVPSFLANKLISHTTDVNLHDYGCTLKAIRSEVAKELTLYGELHRFIPAVASRMGVSIAEMKVNHRPRVSGKTKYGISRTFRVILDLVTVKFLLSYAGRPMHFFGLPGLISTGVGVLLALYMTFEKIFFAVPMGSRPLLAFSILLILIGIQFIVIGLLGELQIRTYYETQNKPIFVVRETVGWGDVD